ncbi:MAG: alginate export family protein, partial [Acidobacteriota bacterium]|nr:alginate export family protein [Acidobacteriota bacterium]
MKRALFVGLLALPCAFAQDDPAVALNQKLLDATRQEFHFTFEERTRWEERYGNNFGKAVNQQDMMSRIRIGAIYDPTGWLRISAMGQDARVPFFGVPAPNSIRDTMDLQEGYIELFHKRKTGFGALAGREMLMYGEGRILGSPQWSNVSRTYDIASLYERFRNSKIEVLMVSPVKVRPDSFNVPDLGERIWGTYDTFGKLWKGATLEPYLLRHSQNKIGGWVGAGTLGTNTFGGRLYGPLPAKFGYSFEGAAQTGHEGALPHRAYAWYASVSNQTSVFGLKNNEAIEYKVASGNQAGAPVAGTFDQLSPANHDKFGHEDLFGWRNLRTLRNLETLNLTKTLALNVMYSDEWLASRTDGLYNSAGTIISISRTGVAGTHVGQELDT